MSDRITYPATPAIQAVAREALGFDPWGGVLANQGESWWNGLERVLPIHLSVGRHVALCELAASLGHTSAQAYWLAFDGDCWELKGAVGDWFTTVGMWDLDESITDDPVAALIAIAKQRASEAGEANR